MYKHNADSIKETQEKQFVSIEDKNRWNSKASGDHNHDNIYNTKSEIDDMLDTTFVNIQDKQISVDSYRGFTKNTEILGRTVQYTEKIKIVPTMESGGINDSGTNADIYLDGILQERYRCRDYIEVHLNDKISYTSNRSMNIFFFDKNKKYIAESRIYCDTTVVNIANAAYMRFYAGPDSKDSEVHIERIHLSDFRSVGELKDDNIYDLEIIRSGKNLLNIPQTYSREMVFGGTNNSHRVVYCKLNNDTDYTISGHHIKSNNERYNGGFHIVLHSEIPNETDKWFLEQPVTSLYRSELPETDVNVTFNSRKHNYLAIYVGIATGEEYNHTSILENFQLEVGTEKTEYEPYTEERVHLSLPVQLEGIGDVSDRLFVREDGIVCIEKRIKEKSYINMPPFIFGDTPNLTNTYMYGIGSACLDASSNILCDKIPTVEGIWNSDREGININGSGNHYILRLSKSRFTNEPTLNEVKDLLNTFNFKYVSSEPEIIELYNINDLSISLENGVNTIQTSSSIHHDIKCSIPMSISTSVESQVDKIEQLKENVSNISNIIGVNNNLILDIKNGYKTVKSNVEGLTTDVFIEGATYVNALDIKFCERNRDDFFTINGNIQLHDSVQIDSDGFVTIEKPAEAGYINVFTKRKLYNVKPNTEYTYILEVVENTLVRTDTANAGRYSVFRAGNSHNDSTGNQRTIFDVNNIVEIFDNQVGVFKFLLTTRDTNEMLEDEVGDRIFIVNLTEGKIKFRVSIVEGNHLDNPGLNKSFMGLCSVSENNELVLESNNKNLFKYTPYNRGNGHYEILDNSVRIHSNGASNKYTFKYFSVDVKPNTTYKISWDVPEVISGKKQINVSLVCNGELIRTYKDNAPNTECIITTDNITGTGDFKLALNLYASISEVESLVGDVIYRNISVIELEDNDAITVTNKSHSKTINLPSPLRSLPQGVKDTIEKIGNQYYIIRRCGYKELNGTEQGWVLNSNDNTQNDTIILFTFGRNGVALWEDGVHVKNTNSYCSGECVHNGGVWQSSYTQQGVAFGFSFDYRVKRSNLETEDLEGFLKYLKANPISVVYELETHIIEPLDIDPNIHIFEGTNHCLVKSGPILPNVKLTLPCNISSTIKVMMDKVQTMENKRQKMIQLLLNSTYESDKTSYRFEVATVNERSISIPEDYDLYNMYKYIIERRNYNRYDLEERIDFYTVISKFSLEMSDELFTMIEEQYDNEVI